MRPALCGEQRPRLEGLPLRHGLASCPLTTERAWLGGPCPRPVSQRPGHGLHREVNTAARKAARCPQLARRVLTQPLGT